MALVDEEEVGVVEEEVEAVVGEVEVVAVEVTEEKEEEETADFAEIGEDAAGSGVVDGDRIPLE